MNTIKEAAKQILASRIDCSDISDDGYVAYEIGVQHFNTTVEDWRVKSEEYRIKLIDSIADDIARMLAYNNEDAEIEQLRDQLDALYMQYLSQVSLWKSRYVETKKELDALTGSAKTSL